MKQKDIPEEHLEALYETWSAFRGTTIPHEILDKRQADSRKVYGNIREWFAQEMGSIETVLFILENLGQDYELFDNVGTFEKEDSLLRRVYITALTRLKQYHIQSVKSLYDGHPFPVWSMIKSMVETIGVLCQVSKTPNKAKDWVGFDKEGTMDTQKLIFAAELLGQCKRLKYNKVTEPVITVDKGLNHMGGIRKEMWQDINNIDHFTYQSVSLVYRNYIFNDPKRIVTREVKDGNDIIESTYALANILWIVCAEGLNHLSLVGYKWLNLPYETMGNVGKSITEM